MPRALWAKAPFVLLQHRAVLLAVLASSFLVALAASSAPLLRAGAESEALKGKLDLMTPLGAGLTVETVDLPSGARADRARRDAARRFGAGLPYVQGSILTTSSYAQVGGQTLAAASPVYVVPMARTGATAHVHRLSGGGDDAWVPGSVARQAKVGPGGTLPLVTGRRAGDGVIVPRATTVEVGAVYRALEADPGNPYWVDFTARIRPINADSATPAPFVLVRQDELYRLSRAIGVNAFRNTYEFPVAPGTMTPDRARRVAAQFADARRSLTTDTPLARSLGCGAGRLRCNVTSSIEPAVILARQSVAALTPVIVLLATFAGLIAVGAALVAGAFNVRRRAGEARLSVVGGERRATFAARAALEAALPVVLGAGAGLAVAALLVRALTPAGTVDGGVIRSAVGAAIASALLAAVAVAAGAWGARGRTIDSAPRRIRMLRVPWELPVLVAAIAVYLLIRSGGGLVHNGTAGSHPRLVVLVLPLLAAAALAGLAIRVARRALGARGSRFDTLYLALRRLIAARSLVVLLVVTAAISFSALTFAEVLGSSLTANSEQKAYVANGSDVQGLVDPSLVLPREFPYPITKVVQSFGGVFVDGSTVDALVVDPRTLSSVIRWPWSHDPRPALQTLASSNASLPVIANDAARGTTSIEIAGKRLPIEVVATVSAFPGAGAGQKLLVLPRSALRRAAARAGIVGDPVANAYAFVWVKGDPAAVSSALARSSIGPTYVTTVDHFLESSDLTTASRTYGYLRVIAFGAALVTLVAMLLYLHTRARSQLVTGALLARMGMSRERQAVSVAFEAMALIAFAAVCGAASALLLAGPLVSHVDPLPQYPPAASVVTPWGLLGSTLAVLVALAGLAGAAAAALAGRAEVGEALRVA